MFNCFHDDLIYASSKNTPDKKVDSIKNLIKDQRNEHYAWIRDVGWDRVVRQEMAAYGKKSFSYNNPQLQKFKNISKDWTVDRSKQPALDEAGPDSCEQGTREDMDEAGLEGVEFGYGGG